MLSYVLQRKELVALCLQDSQWVFINAFFSFLTINLLASRRSLWGYTTHPISLYTIRSFDVISTTIQSMLFGNEKENATKMKLLSIYIYVFAHTNGCQRRYISLSCLVLSTFRRSVQVKPLVVQYSQGTS